MPLLRDGHIEEICMAGHAVSTHSEVEIKQVLEGCLLVGHVQYTAGKSI